ncbi:glycoside hydrolase family 19 protein [Flavobacterium sp. 5]|uniref:glycoside hydrolase family 19 protein n=1 Tax=Flavobacterium sp. 5 TaxID=2035199 RepID=UPI000C2C3535|nr:glycoside hydrolase family 19 protein [Flavobacterium sp. 5]PKB18383.1 putative chitinase [Flavobacterium sp. 5]
MSFIFRHLYYFLQTFRKYNINTPLRIAHFLAQITHETGNFRWLTELGGKSYFKKYDIQFNPKKAKELGNLQKGDGYKFKARGFIHLTGRANYQKYKEYSGIDVINNPALAARIDIALDIAGWYWQNNNINTYSDIDDVVTVTKKVNGGTNQLSERKAYLDYYKLQKLSLPFLETKVV